MIAFLRRVYRQLNNALFDGKLPKVKFLPLRSHAPRNILNFVPPQTAELGTRFVEATPLEILDAFVHVMVHVGNYHDGKPDMGANDYHKANFCSEALRVGLIVENHSIKGWANTYSEVRKSHGRVRMPATAASRRLKAAYAAMPLLAALREFQDQIRQNAGTSYRKTLYRYVCQCEPPMIVRSGRDPQGERPLRATCDVCGAKFVTDGDGSKNTT